MTLTNAKATLGLSSRATPAGTAVNGKPTLGDTSDTVASYTTANVAYCFKVVAAAAANVATLTLSSGVVAQTTGSPVITDGDGNDFEGTTLPTMVKVMAIRLRAAAANAAAIVIAGSSQVLPDIDLYPGADMVIAYPVAGTTITGLTLAATFATLTDTLTVEVLGKTA
jgi:hypothetical protein